MTVNVELTAAEAHVLLAFLRNPDGEAPDNRRVTWLGPTLTTIRQRVEAAIAALPRDECLAVASWGAVCRLAPGHPLDHDWRLVAAESESELRAAYGDR